MLQQFTAHLTKTALAPATVAAYLADLRHFQTWLKTEYDADLTPRTVTARDIATWKRHQQQSGTAPGTVNRRLSAIKRFFAWCVENGHTDRNPAASVKPLEMPTPKSRRLTPAEEKRLTRAVENYGTDRDKAVICLMLGSGLRVSEVLALKRSDIELNERGGALTVRYAKGGKFRRVPVSGSVKRALGEYLKPTNQDDEPVFTGQRGALRHRNSVAHLLKKYSRLAGIAPVTPHQLRHTFAARHYERNRDIPVLARLLGHSSLETTMRYLAPTFEDLAASVEGL